MTRTAALRLLVLIPLALGAAVAVVLLARPLPTMNVLGSPAGWCGPGTSSVSAAQVLIHPGVVVSAEEASTAPGQELVSWCSSRAADRAWYAAGAVCVGGLVGAGLGLVLSLNGRSARW